MKPHLVVITGLLVVCAGCNKAESNAAVTSQASAAAHADPMEIRITGELRERVKAGRPTFANVGASLTVAARLEVDETRVTRVGSPVMGRIKALQVQEGQEVKHGDQLALVNSTGLSDSQLQLLKAQSQKQVAQRAVERAKLLLKAEVIGIAELQRREAELSQATAELDAAHDELILLGMPEQAVRDLQTTRTLNSVSRIVASMDGTVLDRKATLGQVVQPADTVFEIADLSQVWLVADVPEQIAGNLAAGQLVEAEIGAFPGAVIHGRLSFVSATVNEETRTVRVRMDLPNPKRRYKPAMLATMVLKDQPERKLVAPLTAIVREGDQEHLFVQTAPDVFVLRPVEFGHEHGNVREIVTGVSDQDTIILDGAFHLNNERKRLALRGSEGS